VALASDFLFACPKRKSPKKKDTPSLAIYSKKLAVLSKAARFGLPASPLQALLALPPICSRSQRMEVFPLSNHVTKLFQNIFCSNFEQNFPHVRVRWEGRLFG
jgi:hypothetical protein